MSTDSKQHKQNVARIFDNVAHGYDNPSQRFFQFCADQLVASIKPRPGSKLLDIATGTGAAAMAAAQSVGPSGRIQAIDLSEKMLDQAFINLQKTGLNNADLQLMDAEQLDFKSNYFDYAICSFGIFFIPDMLAALKEWLRVLKPGGQVAFTTFTRQAFHPQANMFRETIEKFGVEFSEPGWQRLSTETECRELLQQAGFENVEIAVKQMGYHLANEQDWWELVTNSGFRGYLEQLDAGQQAEFRLQHLAQVRELLTDKGLWLNVETLFARSTKPK